MNMEPNRSSSDSNRVNQPVHALNDNNDSPQGEPNTAAEPKHGYRAVDSRTEVNNQIADNNHPREPGGFSQLRDKLVDHADEQPGYLHRFISWCQGFYNRRTKPAQAVNTHNNPFTHSDTASGALEDAQSATNSGIIKKINDYVIHPIHQFLVKPVVNHVVNPVGNFVAKPITEHVIKPVSQPLINRVSLAAKRKAASIFRHQILSKKGIHFRMDNEAWVQLCSDIFFKAASHLSTDRPDELQQVKIPKLTIETPVGQVVVTDIELKGYLQPPDTESTEVGKQNRVVASLFEHFKCHVQIPLKNRSQPVSVTFEAKDTKVHLGTNLGVLFLLKTQLPKFLRNPVSRDQTAIQADFKELKVDYHDVHSAINIQCQSVDYDTKDPVLMGFNTGSTVFKGLVVNRKVNLLHEESDQTTIAHVQSVTSTMSPDPNRPALITLDEVTWFERDENHSGTLGSTLTLNPLQLTYSPSILMRIVGFLFQGLTTIEFHAPVRFGDIHLKDLQHRRKTFDALPSGQRMNSGYIEVKSKNPLVKWFLGPLLRSGMTRIVNTPDGAALRLGSFVEFQLPGLVAEGTHGNIVVTEFVNDIAGGLLNNWQLIKSKLLLCPKYLEQLCVKASRETSTLSDGPVFSRELLERRRILKQRQHHGEALRCSLAIPVDVFQHLIRDCQDRQKQIEYFDIAHELMDVDTSKSITIFVSLLQKQLSEDSQSPDVAWLIEKALKIEKEQPDKLVIAVDALLFAYQADPFAGSVALDHLLRLAESGHCRTEQISQAVARHLHNGRFDGTPIALAETLEAIEPVIGSQIAPMLSAYPIEPLTELLESSQRSHALLHIDSLSHLMVKHHIHVRVADILLAMQDSDRAQQILEEGIKNNDVEALRARVILEVRKGVIGSHRYVDAARLLAEILSKSDLPKTMRTTAETMLLQLWQEANNNQQVADALCESFSTDDTHTMTQCIHDLFSISDQDITNIRLFNQKMGSLRSALEHVRHTIAGTDPGQERLVSSIITMLEMLRANTHPLVNLVHQNDEEHRAEPDFNDLQVRHGNPEPFRIQIGAEPTGVNRMPVIPPSWIVGTEV